MKRRRFRTTAEEEALRNEPEFQELLKELRSQSPEQLKRLDDYLAEEIQKEGDEHGTVAEEDS